MPDLIEEVPPAFRRLSEDDSLLWSPSIAGVLETGPLETLEARTAMAALTGLVRCATNARQINKLGLSHRKYMVSASAVACNFETGMIGYIDGFNVKETSGDSIFNIHAEQMAIAKARFKGLNRIIGIAVYANPDDEDANPNHYPTLPPCSRCVDMFIHTPEVDEKTLVLSTNLELNVCELYTVGYLADPTNHPKLVSETFALETEADLEHYDREITPYLIRPILNMFRIIL